MLQALAAAGAVLGLPLQLALLRLLQPLPWVLWVLQLPLWLLKQPVKELPHPEWPVCRQS